MNKTIIEYDEEGKKIREIIYREKEANEDFKQTEDKEPHSIEEIINAEKESIDEEVAKRLKERLERNKVEGEFDMFMRWCAVSTNYFEKAAKELRNMIIAISIFSVIALFSAIILFAQFETVLVK